MEMNGLPTKEGAAVVQPLVPQDSSPYRSTTSPGPSRFNLYLACVAANIASFAAGNCFTWTSPTLPRLEEDNEILVITKEESAWIGSLIALGAVFGPIFAGALVNKIGRKWSLTLSVVCIIASWAVLLVARDITMMYAARLIAGVGGGIVYTVVPMYVAEIAEDEVRGALGSMLAFLLCTGFLIPYALGPFISYNLLIFACLVAPILFLAVFPTVMPETPYFLLQQGKEKQALDTLSWLRKGTGVEEVKKELHAMKLSVEEAQRNSGSVKDLVSTVGNRKALLLSCGLVGGQQLSGINVVLFYAEGIFKMTGSQSSELSSIMIAVILILSAGVAAPLVKRFGMKLLLIVSAIGMGIFQGLLGLFFYLHVYHNDTAASVTWLPIVSLVGYVTLYAIGFGPLPWAVMAEMFPANVKAVGSAITASFCWGIGFLMTKFFVDICKSLGECISFWMFTVFCIVMVFFTLILLPDTRGMSFDEIQDVLNNRRVAKR